MKKIVSTLLAVALLAAQIGVFAKDYSGYPQRFWDVPKDHWAFAYISELVDKNVLAGYEDGSYRPEETVTRAEWSKMMVVASGKQEVRLENNGAYAVDYNANDWYYGYVNAVVDYMNFYNESDGVYFKPDQAVSREDVTVSLVKLKGYDTENVDYSVIMSFNDHDSISNSIKKYVAVGVEKGLISGYEDNTFRGQDTLTRAEAATLLCRAFQMGNDNKTNNNPDVVNPDENTNSNSNTSNDTQNDTNTADNGNTAVSSTDENKEDKKEYKVETLAKTTGEITDLRHIVQHDDMIYYYDEDENIINSIDINTGNEEVIFDGNEDIVTYIDEENDVIDNYKSDYIYNIYYDTKRNSIMAIGRFKTINPLVSEQEKSFLIDTKTLESCNEILEANSSYISRHRYMGTNKNGNIYLTNGSSIHESSGRISWFDNTISNAHSIGRVGDSNQLDFCIINNNTYFTTTTGIYKYDYSNFEPVIKFNKSHVGINNNGAYIIQENKLYYLSLDGEIIKEIDLKNDIEIKDSMSIGSIFNKLFVSSNDEVIFYDMTNKCFRMISKND